MEWAAQWRYRSPLAGIHSPVAQNKQHIPGQLRAYQSGNTYEMSEERTAAGNRPEEQWAAAIPHDRLYTRSQRSKHWGYSFPSSWPGARAHIIKFIIHRCSSMILALSRYLGGSIPMNDDRQGVVQQVSSSYSSILKFQHHLICKQKCQFLSQIGLDTPPSRCFLCEYIKNRQLCFNMSSEFSSQPFCPMKCSFIYIHITIKYLVNKTIISTLSEICSDQVTMI